MMKWKESKIVRKTRNSKRNMWYTNKRILIDNMTRTDLVEYQKNEGLSAKEAGKFDVLNKKCEAWNLSESEEQQYNRYKNIRWAYEQYISLIQQQYEPSKRYQFSIYLRNKHVKENTSIQEGIKRAMAVLEMPK